METLPIKLGNPLLNDFKKLFEKYHDFDDVSRKRGEYFAHELMQIVYKHHESSEELEIERFESFRKTVYKCLGEQPSPKFDGLIRKRYCYPYDPVKVANMILIWVGNFENEESE